MKLPKFAIKLSSPFARLWSGRPPNPPVGGESAARRPATVPEADGETIERSILAALEIQSSPIFKLPDELFLEIFASFPILKWSDLYYRYSHTWYTPIPDFYGERTQALSALSVTCRAMRYRFLGEVWERSLMCLKMWRQNDQIPARLQLQCRALTSDRRLATYIRAMTVDLACDGTETILESFARCLAVLPNLHTLEVISMGTHYSEPLCRALKGVRLPQIRTLILPCTSHSLLRHCPNVDDLTCTPFRPDREFVESLAIGRQKLKRFAVLFPGDAIAWAELARVCPNISELSVVYWDNAPGDTRNCITTLNNLSTLQIIYLVPYHDVVPICNMGFSPEVFEEQARYQNACKEKMRKKSEDRWNEVRDMAIEHLKTCSGSGPKVLRTVSLDHDALSGMHFHSGARIEEIQVWE